MLMYLCAKDIDSVSVFTIFVYVHFKIVSHFIQFLLWGLNIFSLQRTETVFFSVFKKKYYSLSIHI